MAYQLSDIFIGTFPIIQNFGARPDVYSARFNLKGHNGIDYGCPTLTLILAAADGIVCETGFDEGAYGNYVKILHDGFLTVYGHLNDISIAKDDRVIAGQLIGHSNSTGLSDTPHLHFGIAPTDTLGNKTQKDNGYGGYIDPLSSLCQWNVLGIKEPVTLQREIAPPISVQAEELSTKTTQANNFQTVLTYLSQLAIGGEILGIDPSDPEAGKKVNMLLDHLITATPLSPPEKEAAKEVADIATSPSMLAKIRGFIFQNP